MRLGLTLKPASMETFGAVSLPDDFPRGRDSSWDVSSASSEGIISDGDLRQRITGLKEFFFSPVCFFVCMVFFRACF